MQNAYQKFKINKQRKKFLKKIEEALLSTAVRRFSLRIQATLGLIATCGGCYHNKKWTTHRNRVYKSEIQQIRYYKIATSRLTFTLQSYKGIEWIQCGWISQWNTMENRSDSFRAPEFVR